MINTFSRLIHVLRLSIILTLLTTAARAQDPIQSAVSHVGIGAGINFYRPSSSESRPSQGVTLVYRWHTFHSGWGPTFGLDWRRTDFNQAVGSLDAPLGSLRMRALLAGVGHTQRIGRFSTSASMSGGYAFNHLFVNGAAGPAFASTGISLVGVRVRNSATAKSEVSAWYDVTKHAGVGVTAAYLLARPEEVMTTTTGSHTRHLRADAVELTAGVTFGVWKKR